MKPPGTLPLHLVPIHLSDANEFVRLHHRTHKRVPGCKFCVGVADGGGQLRGVAICGRPIARHTDDGWTLEVNRTCTDGTPNANSMLYGAAWRAAKALGYRRVITFTMEGESGASLRGAGFREVGRLQGASWSCPSRGRYDFDHTVQTKIRWQRDM